MLISLTDRDRAHIRTARYERTSATSLVVLAGLAALAALYAARTLLWPVMLAAFLALLLTAPVEALQRRRVPRTLAALLVLAIVACAGGALVNAVWEPGRAWVQSAPQTLRTIQTRIAPVQHATAQLDELAAKMERLAKSQPGQPVAASNRGSVSAALLAAAPLVAINSITVLIITLFLLAGGPPLLCAWLGQSHREATVRRLRLVETVRQELGKYFGTIALINLGLGLATTGAMAALKVPNPLLWGCVAATLNFVPYVGPAVTMVLLAVTTLVAFPTLLPTLEVLGVFLLLITVEGQVIEPLFVGRRLHVSPLVIFLAVWAGAWLWGVAGVVLATPVVIAAKAAITHRRSTIATVLAEPSDGPPQDRAQTRAAPERRSPRIA